MLFNSYIFIFLFLPITLALFYGIRRTSNEGALLWLVVASLFFYGWWNPPYVIIIVVSMLANFSFGVLINRKNKPNIRKILLILGVSINLMVLAYYKYADFFIGTLNSTVDVEVTPLGILLPLAISFFTFQQIAYLVDTYRNETQEYNFLHYGLFVTFFPQLIAGPIVHHKEMLPQFMRKSSFSITENLTIGLTIFFVGLFKKVYLADNISAYATPVFNAADAGTSITFFEAWGGALSYTLQLYFDFSGYSDMALGLARMFGIILPLNFFSPYKSRNIIEFWRRWHMTLSRFLRDYLYISLGGNRQGSIARYRNLFITMLLGGLWHGAAWTFVFWGALHGFYLMLCHGWGALTKPFQGNVVFHKITTPFAYTLTFLGVVVGWVFFRAETFSGATTIINGMMGLNGITLHPDSEGLAHILGQLGLTVDVSYYATRFVEESTAHWIVALLFISWVMPNTAQWMARINVALDESGMLKKHKTRWLWQPTLRWAIALVGVASIGLLHLNEVSEFLYFQF